MSVRQEERTNFRNGKVRKIWMVHFTMEYPDGTKDEIRKVPTVRTKRQAEKWESAKREELLENWINQKRGLGHKEVPTFAEWFNGRYWNEWVVGRKNKPSTVEGKRSAYETHLKAEFGLLRLDQIGVSEIAQFRAKLVEKDLKEKTINNILAVLSKALRYAADVELIPKAPKVGLFKVEPPEIVFWEFDQYVRILRAAQKEGSMAFAAACLAGEAGLRVGEVKGLRWRGDVDMIAKTITVNQQMRKGIVGTPKGRTRRTVPMTDTLYEALRSLRVVREGYVIRNLPGQAKSKENQIKNMMYRICRLAGLPERGWHILRHTFGTHAAMFGVNAWTLMTWLGHKRIEQTMQYVHLVGSHSRPIPDEVVESATTESDPNQKVIRMLGTRINVGADATSQQHHSNTKKAHQKLVGF